MTTAEIEYLKLLLSGLAAGDSIGATTEFVEQGSVPAIYFAQRDKGWPFKAIGGGAFGWEAGQATDDTDMSMCIIRAFLAEGEFDPQAVCREFLKWYASRPRDIGGTTRSALRNQSLACWNDAAEPTWRTSPHRGDGNGALMRNGVVPAMSSETLHLDEVFRNTVTHAIMTHYAPLSTLCCLFQSWLIYCLDKTKEEALTGIPGMAEIGPVWQEAFHADLTAWMTRESDAVVNAYFGRVAMHLPAAMGKLYDAIRTIDAFDPFVGVDYTGRSGYVLLTLQIALWAMLASRPMDLRRLPGCYYRSKLQMELGKLGRSKWYKLGWVALVGHDADTYGAVAGPILAAAYGPLPKTMTDNLKALEEFERLVKEHAQTTGEEDSE